MKSFAAILFCLATVNARAVPDETGNVGIYTTFPEGKTFTAGQDGKALITFENKAEHTYQIEHIKAFLAPCDSNGKTIGPSAQNFTGILVNRTINIGETVSVLYSLKVRKDVNPVQYKLVFVSHYSNEDDDDVMNKKNFHEIIDVTDGTSAFDLEGIFMLLVIAALGYGAYVAFFLNRKKKFVAPAPVSKKSGGASKVQGTSGADLDFIPAEHRRAVRSNSPKKN